MTDDGTEAVDDATFEAVAQLNEAANAKKCWRCDCLHSSLKAIEDDLSEAQRSPDLNTAIDTARARLVEVKYDCLGCDVCYPAIAINALEIEAATCATEEVEEREGWPPLPGDYAVLRYHAPVAVCTLTDDGLAGLIATRTELDVAVVGTLQTENLGIERLISNIVSNSNIRFLIVCGPDSQRTIGHLPGQSIVALARNGLDEQARIIGAQGKRPSIRNIPLAAVEHFRRNVEVLDLVGMTEVDAIISAIQDCAKGNPGPSEAFTPDKVVKPLVGYVPERMVSDPAGYFVVYLDRQRHILSLGHYQNNGVLDTIIEGKTVAELYIPAVEKGLVSRLDHAAYLGQELARAEQALLTGEPYIQDGAPEYNPFLEDPTTCGCGSACKGGSS